MFTQSGVVHVAQRVTVRHTARFASALTGIRLNIL
jgi:hypothetical protein